MGRLVRCKYCKLTRKEAGVNCFYGDFCSEECMDSYHREHPTLER